MMHHFEVMRIEIAWEPRNSESIHSGYGTTWS